MKLELVEKQSMDVVNALLSIDDFPFNRLKSMKLFWEPVGGAYLPKLECDFFIEEKRSKVE